MGLTSMNNELLIREQMIRLVLSCGYSMHTANYYADWMINELTQTDKSVTFAIQDIHDKQLKQITINKLQ